MTNGSTTLITHVPFIFLQTSTKFGAKQFFLSVSFHFLSSFFYDEYWSSYILATEEKSQQILTDLLDYFAVIPFML